MSDRNKNDAQHPPFFARMVVAVRNIETPEATAWTGEATPERPKSSGDAATRKDVGVDAVASGVSGSGGSGSRILEGIRSSDRLGIMGGDLASLFYDRRILIHHLDEALSQRDEAVRLVKELQEFVRTLTGVAP